MNTHIHAPAAPARCARTHASRPSRSPRPALASRPAGRLSSVLRALLPLAVGSLLSVQSLAQATPNPPERMTYQGYVVDANGTVLGANAPKNYDIIFRIWKSEAGTATSDRLWTEQQTVTVDKGYFSVLLGEGSSIGESRPLLSTVISGNDASERYVGLTVKGIGPGGTDADILPRLRLLTSPYSFLAARAMTVDAGAVSSGTVADARLSGNVALRAGGNTFTGDQVVNGSVKVTGQNAIELGAGAGKQGDAGKIGYQTLSPDALDIVGAGADANSRKVKVWAEGGATVTGPVTATGTVTASAFIGDGTVPLGAILMWSGSVANIPSGWALCDGSKVNGQQTPNLRDRFIVGAGGNYAPGSAGGNYPITLNGSQLPSHQHSYRDGYYVENVDPNKDWTWRVTPAGGGIDYLYDLVGDSRLTGSSGTDHDNNAIFWRYLATDAAGGSQPIDNRPPFYALAYIMRVR